MLLPVTVPKPPWRIGLVASVIAFGVSLTMLSRSTEKPKGSLLSTVLLVIRSLMMAGESQPSLLRSLPVWSEIRKRPPPFFTKFISAVFSAAEKTMFGSSITTALKLLRSRLAPVP